VTSLKVALFSAELIGQRNALGIDCWDG
ncbi:hypothetical protein D049_2412B, partial [Vibrio parahaemolyticus VPTS-2010]